ncbi:Uncharacterised protein [Mycobacteroides abscessus subsp. massiliense]|nr:Uncharacterised protein [Mycobacteroides abscessus subsp. massiliense]
MIPCSPVFNRFQNSLTFSAPGYRPARPTMATSRCFDGGSEAGGAVSEKDAAWRFVNPALFLRLCFFCNVCGAFSASLFVLKIPAISSCLELTRYSANPPIVGYSKNKVLLISGTSSRTRLVSCTIKMESIPYSSRGVWA